MSAGGKGDANDADVAAYEAKVAAYYVAANGEAGLLDKLAREAEAAAQGAVNKVEKQKAHLAEAQQSAKTLLAEAKQARKAADNAK